MKKIFYSLLITFLIVGIAYGQGSIGYDSGISNPLTANLDAGGFDITGAGAIDADSIDVDTAVINSYVSGDVSISGATPSVDFYDSDATAGDINAQILANATATGDGTEDIDVTLYQQIAGTLTAWLTADADGSVTIGSGRTLSASTFSDGTASFTGGVMSGLQYRTLDPTPASDDTGNGDIASVTVDTNALGVGACLYMASDGNYDTTDADAVGTADCTAIALESGTGTKDVLLQGYMRNDGWNWGTVGGAVFVSTTTGELTQTAPSGASDAVKRVGIATSDDEILFNPFYSIAVIAS